MELYEAVCHCRKSPERIKQLADSADSKYALLHKYSGLLRRTEATQQPQQHKYEVAIVPKQDLSPEAVDHAAGLVFLGLDADQHPYFAAYVIDTAVPILEKVGPDSCGFYSQQHDLPI